MDAIDKEILSKLTMDDLEEQHRQIAEVIGIECLLKLAEHFSGSGIYLPQLKTLVMNKIHSTILDEYDGTNVRQLASKYQVSQSTVYNIVREKILKGSAKKQMPGQINIFDMELT